MKRLFFIIFSVLLCLAVLASLNFNGYVGLSGLLEALSSIDFSFSETTQVCMDMVSSFEKIASGNGGDIIEATQGLFDLVRIPFVAIYEIIKLLADIFDFLFLLVGAF